MKAYSWRLAALVPMSLAGACADQAGPTDPAVSVSVAPLTLPGVLDVEYAVAVFNANPAATPIFDEDGNVINNITEKVWGEPSVTSSQFGNGVGGDITYIGPCDAQNPTNWVALALKQVAVGAFVGTEDGVGVFTGVDNVLDDQFTTTDGLGQDDGDADFVNPSPTAAALVLAFDCVENQDTPVIFNLTIMRDADQGFFDVAVNFEDVFCSAKFETCYPDDNGTPTDAIMLLHGPNEGDGRQWTGISGLACTVGPDSADPEAEDLQTELLLTNPQVACQDGEANVTFSIDLADAVQGEEGNGQVTGSDLSSILHYGLYFGAEDLQCEGASCNKVYYNIAINLEDLADQNLTNCTMHFTASAHEAGDGSFDGGELGDSAGQYGAIHFGSATQPLQLLDGSGPSCNSNPLDAPGSLVTPGYIMGDDYEGGGEFDGFDVRTNGGPATDFTPEG